MMYLGDYAEDDTVYFMWSSNNGDGASITRATNGTISVYKDNSTTQSTAGITDTEDFDSVTGLHHVAIDLSSDAFYATGADYMVVLSGATIDTQSVNAVIAHFSIENRYERGTDSAYTGTPPTAAAIADAVWDESTTGHTTAGTFGEQVKTDIDAILVDTAEIGAAGAGLTAVPWNASWDAEVESEVTDALNTYDPPTKTEMDSGFSALNDPTAAAIADAVWDESTTGHTTAGTFGEQVKTDIDAILTDTAEIGAAGAGLTAVPWNASWDAEVESEVTDALNTYDPPTKAELDSGLAALNDPTAAAIADAVWDESTTGHTTVGTFGEQLKTDVDAILADTAEIGTAGAGLTSIPWNASWDAEVESEVTDALNTYDPPTKAELDTGFAALNDLSAAAVNAEVDTALSDIGLDHLLSASVAGTDVADDSVVAKLVSASVTSDWDDFDNTTDSLQAIRDRGDTAWTTGAAGNPPQQLVSTTIATLSTQTSFTLTAGSADDDAYNGMIAVITDQSTSSQKCVGRVGDYTGSTKTVTLEADPGVFTVAAGDSISILAVTNHIELVDTTTTNTDMLTLAGINAEVDTALADYDAPTKAELDAGFAALNDPTAGAIADAVWDESTTGHTTAGTFGEQLKTDVDAILVDTAEIGAAGAGLAAVPWNASWDAEVESEVTDALNAYDPPTKAELDSGLAALNDPTAAAIADAVWDESTTGHTSAGTFGEQVKTDIDAILTDTAEIGAAGAGLTAVPWNSSWDAEVESEVTDALNAYDPPTKAELDSGLAGLNDPTAAAIADAVWDESTTGHTTAGTFGEQLKTDVDSILADTAEIGVAGAGLTAIPWNSSWDAEVESEVTDALNSYDPPTKTELDAGFAALNDLSAAEVNAEVDTALADIHLDHLLAADYDPASKPGTATALLNELVENDAGVSRFTANALEQAPGASAPSAAAIADAVWDESTTGHTTAGTFGEQLKTDVDAILADTAEIGTAGAGLTSIPWNASWDTEVESEVTDALNSYDPPTKAELDTAMTEVKGSGFDSSTDTLEKIRDSITAVPADVWSYGSRTLTSYVVASYNSPNSSGDVSVYRASTWEITFTGLGDFSDYSNIWFTAKRKPHHADNKSIVQVDLSTGLLVANSSDDVTPANGTITVDDAAGGQLTVKIDESVTSAILAGEKMDYDIKVLRTGGDLDVLADGRFKFNILDTATRRVS